MVASEASPAAAGLPDPKTELKPETPPTKSAADAAANQAETKPPAAPAKEPEPTPTPASAPPAISTAQTGGSDAPGSYCGIDPSRPKEFEGEVPTNDDLPTPELIKKIEDYVVLDAAGKTHTFKSLYNGRNVARRVLIIFVRHFFCGNCQEFLRSLSESITPEALLGLPVSTFIAVIGCGDPALIDMYIETTGCQFPVYTDPTKQIFESLGLAKTWAMGERPAYMQKAMVKTMVDSIFQGLKQLKSGLATKAGDQRQVGGEFLFEPLSVVTPISTPINELERRIGEVALGEELKDENDLYGPEEKRVTWCHRMRTTRDHAEIPELMEILGLDGDGQPIKDQKRWLKAVGTRKGTGLSMASQTSRLSEQGGPR